MTPENRRALLIVSSALIALWCGAGTFVVMLWPGGRPEAEVLGLLFLGFSTLTVAAVAYDAGWHLRRDTRGRLLEFHGGRPQRPGVTR